MPFPLGSSGAATPSYYAQCSFPSSYGAPFGVFYVGGVAPRVTLSQATPTAYYVKDYFGNTVSSGSTSGLTCTPAAPGGGWNPGWYRIYFTGGSTDTTFGTSYGA